MIKRIGILTGGGDAPGLNGVIESVVRSIAARRSDIQLVGIHDGFEGLFKKNIEVLTPEKVFGAHALAGTLLGTSNKSSILNREKEFIQNYRALGFDALLACGGDGTFSALSRVKNEINLIGVPKTIDNDLSGTEITFGYDTACSVVSEAVDSLRATASAHNRVMVVETMGRTTGWIALGAAMSSYAEVVLMPERSFSKSDLKSYLSEQMKIKRGLVVVVAEGAQFLGEEAHIAFRVMSSPQTERYGGIAHSLAFWIEKELGWESRAVVLGHLQRSRHPTNFDISLSLRLGSAASDLVLNEKWNHSVVFREGKIKAVPIEEVMGPVKKVPEDHEYIQILKNLGSFI